MADKRMARAVLLVALLGFAAVPLERHSRR